MCSYLCSLTKEWLKNKLIWGHISNRKVISGKSFYKTCTQWAQQQSGKSKQITYFSNDLNVNNECSLDTDAYFSQLIFIDSLLNNGKASLKNDHIYSSTQKHHIHWEGKIWLTCAYLHDSDHGCVEIICLCFLSVEDLYRVCPAWDSEDWLENWRIHVSTFLIG